MASSKVARKQAKAAKPPPRGRQQALSSATPAGLLALHLLSVWTRSGPRGVVFLAGNQPRAERLGAILHALNPDCGVLVLPALDALPFDEIQPSRDIAGRRASVLRRLAEHAASPLVVSTADAMLPRVPRPEAWRQASLRLKLGQSLSSDEMQGFLARAGYEVGEPADYPGGVLIHGNAVEIFPAGALGPVRIEHADGLIGAIRLFNPETQADDGSLDSLTIDPMSEFNVAEAPNRADKHATTNIFAYLDSAMLVSDADVPRRAEARIAAIEDAARETSGRQAAFMTLREWQQASRRLEVLAKTSDVEMIPAFSLQTSVRNALREFITERRRDGARLMFTAAGEQDLQRMERLAGVQTLRCPDWKSASRPPAGKITSLQIDLDAGFRIDAAPPVLVIAAADVLGSRAHRSQPMARQPAGEAEAAMKLVPGGAVVHLQRGHAVLKGLEEVSASELSGREMVRLGFADDEAVLLPLAELALVWPYATDAAGIKLDDADGRAWLERREQAEREIDRIGRRLSQLKRDRQRVEAPRIVPPTAEYERFVVRFPYSATPDQAMAIEDVLKDLASGHPMDRIVCGDVGFGKTEVALRAAAATILSGRQVALVVPTTVLARQHLLTFRKRFAPFGVEIAALSRLTSAADARRLKSQLRDGSLKLVIGTHAVAGKDIEFADLGLVIVDEEQHFGAADKARLSALAAGVHTLTMSATPIPRSLSGAIAGLRDLSVIATAPVQRAPVITRVLPFLDATLATALRREHSRRGQSFVICPRIKDIEPMLGLLRRIAPELHVVAMHGRLPARELDDRMMQFVSGKADVLLSTNIVENGLDIPRANTIAICSPEHFGLAQLHQLRGRVGRGGTRAFAYFLTETQGEQAEERMSVIQELSRPGAGFQISARDLDLRGAGDLLSEQQAGHIQVLGPALHNYLLRCAMLGTPRRAADMWVPEIHVDASALLPTSFVQDEATRLDIYARLARAESHDEVEDIGDEIRLRFGSPPAETSNMIALANARLDCRALGIERIDAGPLGLAAHLRPGTSLQPGSRAIRRDGQRLVCKHAVKAGQEVQSVLRLIEALEHAAAKTRPATAALASSSSARAIEKGT